MASPRVFTLVRDQDVTGISGTGTVADGVVWPDGTVSIRWRGDRPSIVFWDSLDHAEAIHGHGGATQIVWVDVPQGTGEFSRGFRLHHDGQVYDGAQFPSGRAVWLDHPERGLATAVASLDHLPEVLPGARLEWPPAGQEGS
jgi:hypothetical protein